MQPINQLKNTGYVSVLQFSNSFGDILFLFQFYLFFTFEVFPVSVSVSGNHFLLPKQRVFQESSRPTL